MRKRLFLLMFFLGLSSLAAKPWLTWAVPGKAIAAPEVFSSPINAGCIQVTPSVCRLHIDPFTIQVTAPQHLAAFQLQANSVTLYDFRTDVSNPPSGNYTPSAVKLDFAATCGETYTVNLLARDTGDPSFLNAGQADNITCPAGTYTLTLPMVVK